MPLVAKGCEHSAQRPWRELSFDVRHRQAPGARSTAGGEVENVLFVPVRLAGGDALWGRAGADVYAGYADSYQMTGYDVIDDFARAPRNST